MALYSADDIVDKSLFCKKACKARKYADPASQVVFQFSSGDYCGTVYSYSEKAGKLWWYMQGSPQYWIMHEEGLFDMDKLDEQGVLTVKQKAELANEESKGFFDKLGEGFADMGSWLKWAIGAFILIFVVKFGFESFQNLKKSRK